VYRKPEEESVANVIFPIEDAGVTTGAVAVYDAVIDAVDWKEVRHVVQLAGGSGAFLAAILHRLPDATGVLFDAPGVVAEAGPTLYAAGVTDRVDLAGGDVFTDIPPGGDVYFVAHVLRGWTDERTLRFLRHCHAVMSHSARLVVAETNSAPERSCDHWQQMLAEAGFVVTNTTDVGWDWSVVESRPA
jgi:O-methyltransferase domain